jgi:chitinase
VFTGVSIDWEYLSNNGVNYGNTGNVVDPSDSANFVLFVQTLRELFNQNNWTKYTIALCCTSAPEKIQFDVASLIPLLDEWHVMTYEYVSLAKATTLIVVLPMDLGQTLRGTSLT